ncbi:MAG TPA: hypothetical protein VKY57_09970 [Chitinispirillaceae bacterium]|nr:hypothetical protein [Chitinispirillaceae bacterium]
MVALNLRFECCEAKYNTTSHVTSAKNFAEVQDLYFIRKKATSMKWVPFTLLLLISLIAAQESLQYITEDSDPVLILTARGSIFDQARNGLVNEIRDEFAVSIVEINEETSLEDIDKQINGYKDTKAVVLIGNNAIRTYKKYSSLYKEKTESVQIVSLLALDIQRAVSGLENVTGIAYETPMVTALVNFRRVISKPLNKVGVLYRNPFKEFVKQHTLFCSREGITIEGIEISDDTSKHHEEINNSLQVLLKEKNVDAFWLVNDNVLLKPHLLGNVWIPVFKKGKVPLIAGVESLVDPKLDFGTFAVIPDPVALGEQAAEIIFDLKLDNWEHSGIMIYPAISMYSVLNFKKATEITDKKNLKTYEVSKVLYKSKRSKNR